MDEDGVEGGLLGLLTAGEDHAGHPEEDDVIARDQHVGGVEIVQVLGLFGPAQGREGPQGGGEPGVQHVGVPVDVGRAALLADGGVGAGHGHVAAVVAVPHGDLVAPPQLTGDAPVVHVLHPVEIGLGEAVGDELGLPFLHHANGLLGQGCHLDEPLGGNNGLHVVVAAVAGADVVAVRLFLLQQTHFLQIGDDGLAALVAVHALVLAAVGVHDAVVVQDADGLQVVAQADLKVVGVVGGGHLHAAGAEVHLHIIVGHDGNFPVHDGQDAGLAHQVLVALVVGVHGHAGVAHHGLRAGGGNDQIAGAVGQGVAHVPQVAGLVHILHLGVGQGGDAVGAPVDDAAALVDQALFIQLTESLANGLGAALVHGEAGAVPVAGGTHLLLLGNNTVAVLVLPVPHALQELLPAQVIAGQALFYAQLFLHFDLGGDAGVVRAGDPQGGVALHALEADQNILQGAVHGVAHVELTGDVGGRHDDGVGLLLGVPHPGKTLVLLPLLVDAFLYLVGIVDFGQFFFHGVSSFLDLLDGQHRALADEGLEGHGVSLDKALFV